MINAQGCRKNAAALIDFIMKKYDIIVWDFNGTVLDDVQIGIESINCLLGRRGMKQISSRSEYQESFGFPIIEWYRSLGFDFEKESYTVVANEWVAEYVARESEAPLCDGVIDLAEYFKNEGNRQVIISASEENMLNRQLLSLGVRGYYDEVIGKNDVYASGKIETARKWRAENQGDILFIGDTDHDLDVADAIDADCVLVAAGHQSYDRLCSLRRKLNKKLVVVRHLREIIDIL